MNSLDETLDMEFEPDDKNSPLIGTMDLQPVKM